MLPFDLGGLIEESPPGSGNFVRFQDSAIQCVVFLGFTSADAPDDFRPKGTGFVVSVGPHHYVVTAAHVSKDLGDGGFVVRMNERGGLGKNHHIDHAEWIKHPTDESVDIAVMEFDPPRWADLSNYPRRGMLSEFKLGSKGVGPGDLAYVVGLFRLLHGKKRIMPTVHTGHIALMPGQELVPILDWRLSAPTIDDVIEIEAYLVEAQVLDGASGSPVFMRRSIRDDIHKRGDKAALQAWKHGSLWLLGVLHGAWFGPPSDVLKAPAGSKVPAGMAIVTPAVKLIEVLEQPLLNERRAQLRTVAVNEHFPEKLSAGSVAKVRDGMPRTMLSMPPQPRKRPSPKRVRSK